MVGKDRAVFGDLRIVEVDAALPDRTPCRGLAAGEAGGDQQFADGQGGEVQRWRTAVPAVGFERVGVELGELALAEQRLGGRDGRLRGLDSVDETGDLERQRRCASRLNGSFATASSRRSISARERK